ncbi:MAG TPA: hypothetical protein VFL55_05450 [Acetobacteraceae bacterium]|nr:hypothetical protein [Acetobacteraceae bacterium]
MNAKEAVPDQFAFSGERLDRLRQALKLVEHQARLAQGDGYGRNVQDATVDIEGAVTDLLALLGDAVEDDKAEAEERGEAERARRAWFPHYRAA